jgi:pyrroloquinoline quinone biosynthesis protein B
MRVKILGSAAGGGFPQWNCACRNCRAVRAGNFPGKARSQAQVAVSHDGESWFLLGASPDLRSQIESFPELHPREGLRQSSVAGVLLASADLDHVLGLLLMRELQPLRVYGTASVLRILRQHNSMFGMLNRVANQVEWNEIAVGQEFCAHTISRAEPGLKCRSISLGTRYPAYAHTANGLNLDPSEALLGLLIESQSGAKLAYMPAVPEITDALLNELQSTDLLFFDGTFWSDDELIQVQGKGETARQMGHTPVSSAEGTLQKLAGLRRPRKIFLHINNTNPMLDESGPEFKAVREAGWEIAEDGWHFEL